MKKMLFFLLFLAFWGLEVQARRGRSYQKNSSWVALDGISTKVYWNDGDTFKILNGFQRGKKARLYGYNTLENYGAVHRWGNWDAQALYREGEKATLVARSRAWKCKTQPGSGGYGRLLVYCKGLAKALISSGYAHVYSIRGAGEADLVVLQKKAIEQKVGIWKHGAPSAILTSLHSMGESRRYRVAYNRTISTMDGSSRKVRHTRRYRTCSWVCLQGSCMLYVPYRNRYGYRKASCL